MTEEELQAKVSIQRDIISKANYQIYKDVTEYIEGLPYKVDDKISCDRFSVCWISSITPINIGGPTIFLKSESTQPRRMVLVQTKYLY